MDRTGRLLDELKVAEARSDSTETWSESGRRRRLEVRRLRAAWDVARIQRFARAGRDDATHELRGG